MRAADTQTAAELVAGLFEPYELGLPDSAITRVGG